MKKFAAVIDVSPSEQLGDNDNEIFSFAILVGLRSQKSFDNVGSLSDNQELKINLKKYSKSNDSYKINFKNYLIGLKKSPSPNVLTGISIVNQKFIKRVGLETWIKISKNEIPQPSSFNKKNKPRVRMGGYKVDNAVVNPYELLIDDLCIIGWLMLEIGLFHKLVCDINKELVSLDLIIDRLPNDKGVNGTNKAVLLKYLLKENFNNLINIVGIPDKTDTHQRDLLVDNLAGFGRELYLSESVNYNKEVANYFSFFNMKIE